MRRAGEERQLRFAKTTSRASASHAAFAPSVPNRKGPGRKPVPSILFPGAAWYTPRVRARFTVATRFLDLNRSIHRNPLDRNGRGGSLRKRGWAWQEESARKAAELSVASATPVAVPVQADLPPANRGRPRRRSQFTFASSGKSGIIRLFGTSRRESRAGRRIEWLDGGLVPIKSIVHIEPPAMKARPVPLGPSLHG